MSRMGDIGFVAFNIAFGVGPFPWLERYLGLSVTFSIAFGVVSSPPLKRYWSGFFTTAQEISEWFLHHLSRDIGVVSSPPLMMFHLYVYSLGIAFLYWFFGATRNIEFTLWNSYLSVFVVCLYGLLWDILILCFYMLPMIWVLIYMIHLSLDDCVISFRDIYYAL